MKFYQFTMPNVSDNTVINNSDTIHAIDAHPDGTRIAIGGIRSDSGGIVAILQSAFYLLDAEDEERGAESTNYLLCMLTTHDGGVNCVRFSRGGLFLASGSVDHKVIVYSRKRSGLAAPTIGECSNDGSDAGRKENWGVHKILGDNEADVQDISWSPKDDFLASASVDGAIRIYRRTNRTFKPFQKLKGHEEHVKGISFGPTGRYLVSQGGDGIAIIWRYDHEKDDFTQAQVISEPLNKRTSNMSCLRPDWFADGTALLLANGYDGLLPTLPVIQLRRETDGEVVWRNKMNMIGFQRPVGTIRSNPRMFRCEMREGAMNVFAVGTGDSTVAVYVGHQRPIVFTDMADESISDIAWSASGCTLYVAFGNDRIVVICFAESELGAVVKREEQQNTLESLHGSSPVNLSRAHQNCIAADIMDPEMEEYEKAKKLQAEREKKEGEASLVNGLPDSMPTEQTETRRKDGKRRITPRFHKVAEDQPSEELLSNVLPVSHQMEDVQPPVMVNGDVRPEALSADHEAETPSARNTTSATEVSEPIGVMKVAPIQALERHVVVMRKRRRPMVDDADDEQALTRRRSAESVHADGASSEQSQQTPKKKRGRPRTVSRRRESESEKAPPRRIAVRTPPPAAVTLRHVATAFSDQLVMTQLEPLGDTTLVTIGGCTLTFSSINTTLTARKEYGITGNTVPLWTQKLSSRPLAIQANNHFTVFVGVDLHFRALCTRTGALTIGPLAIGYRVHRLTLDEHDSVCVMLANGKVLVWNLRKQSMPIEESTSGTACELLDTKIAMLAAAAAATERRLGAHADASNAAEERATHCNLGLVSGTFVVELSSGESGHTLYAFDRLFAAWHRVDVPPTLMPAAFIDADIGLGRGATDAPAATPSDQLQLLENAINVSITMRSKSDFARAARLYVRKLTDVELCKTNENRVRRLFDYCVGPPTMRATGGSAQSATPRDQFFLRVQDLSQRFDHIGVWPTQLSNEEWFSTIGRQDKRCFLESELLPFLTKLGSWRDIFNEYKRIIHLHER